MYIEQEISRWKREATDPTIASQLTHLLDTHDTTSIEDAFYRRLSFGTAGLRGILGPGTNRMNIYTVGQATQGLATYVTKHFDQPSVAICRDSRHLSYTFARLAACVLAANNIHVFMYPRIEPTPTLSFAVRKLHCQAGINITASHNPANYNGYKVYGSDGCQITEDAAAEIESIIDATDMFSDVAHMDFDEGIQRGLITHISDDVLDDFITAVLKQSLIDPDAQEESLRLVYTPLNGTGLECMSKMLPKIGVTDVHIVPEQEKPDGDFPTCPYPNPEIRQALEKGIELSEKVKPDLLLATDPDADRVGIAVKNGADYQLLTGNEVGILLLDYICMMREKLHTMPENPVAVSTIVSTSMIDAIAKDHGVEIVRTLTGFKYIGDTITRLAEKGESDRFILGFEESYGYLTGDHVRDKDAINASMLICEMAQHYKAHGLNLAEAIQKLYTRYGFYRNQTVSYQFPGEDGSKKMASIMSHLRNDHPTTIAGMDVVNTIDYAQGIKDLPKANVVEFDLPESNKLVIRPSGTEPKIKAYLFAKADTNDKARNLINKLHTSADTLLKA